MLIQLNIWNKFRQDAITNLLVSINYINNNNLEIKLSAAENHLLTAKKRYMHWDSWLNNGLLDFVVPMNYYSEVKDFNNDIQIMKYFIDKSLQDKIVMGIATYNQSADDAADKI